MAFNITVSDQLRLAMHFVQFKTNQKLLRTSETIIADTEYGKIKGVKWKCLYGNSSYFSFEGIPYAKPPLGDLRFKAPVEPEPWNDIKNCKKQRSKPCQFNVMMKKMVGSEDCLYLNVYTPNLEPTTPLPVLVWIYGGGFQMGDTSREVYSPDYFIMENVILVTLNYRIGAFGFLSLRNESLDVPGNTGLKDQLLALKWIKRNCTFFGGDPNNITIFGESAGGVSVHLLMLTEKSRGLFQKAVIMSGSALVPWALVNDHDSAFRLANATGYKGENTDSSVLEYLQKAKPSWICKWSNELLTREERERRLMFSFAPIVEPYITEHCILPEHPLYMMRDCWSNEIPLLIGGCSFEGLLLFTEVRKYKYLLNDMKFEDMVPNELELAPAERHKFAEILRQEYFADKKPSPEAILEYCDLSSYKYFWHGIHRTLLSRRENARQVPTYLYRFDFDSKNFNFVRNVTCGRKYDGPGTCHADDLGYMFYNGASKKLRKNSPEYKTIRRLTGLITYFARTGNPNMLLNNTSGSVYHCNVTWESCHEQEEPWKCLNISKNLEIIELPEYEKLQLWDLMYEKHELF